MPVFVDLPRHRREIERGDKRNDNNRDSHGSSLVADNKAARVLLRAASLGGERDHIAGGAVFGAWIYDGSFSIAAIC